MQMFTFICMQVICHTENLATQLSSPGWWQATDWSLLWGAQNRCKLCSSTHTHALVTSCREFTFECATGCISNSFWLVAGMNSPTCNTLLHTYYNWNTLKHALYCSYFIMTKCWRDDKELRPTFQELKDEFDSLISHEERYEYLPLASLMAETDLAPAEECAEASALDQPDTHMQWSDTYSYNVTVKDQAASKECNCMHLLNHTLSMLTSSGKSLCYAFLPAVYNVSRAMPVCQPYLDCHRCDRLLWLPIVVLCTE